MRPAAFLAGTCVVTLCVVGMLTGSYQRQLAAAAAQAQDRMLTLERILAQERAALAAERGLRASERECCASHVAPDALRAAARAEVRDALLQASRAAAGPAAGEHERLSAQGELAAVELREAAAAEDPGWCRCPALPNITRLCQALAPPLAGGARAEAARARAEVDALRGALTEANLRAQEAEERALEHALLA